MMRNTLLTLALLACQSNYVCQAVQMKPHVSKAATANSTRLRRSLVASAAQTSSELWRFFSGEFHDSAFSKKASAELLQSPKCKDYYSLADLPRSPTIVDPVGHLFRPAVEVPAIQDLNLSPWGVEVAANVSLLERPSLESAPFLRMLTYEDVKFPRDFQQPRESADPWCEMFAVRTPQRPVKVMTASDPRGEKKTVVPAIWKAASTSLTSMFADAQSKGFARNVIGPHISKCKGCCTKPNVLEQCEKHTTFDDDAAESNVKAAVVRSPLDRFLASVYEHGEWKSCDGDVCDKMVEDARNLAVRLATEFPHKFRSCEHPSQSYFLSATDVHGKPYVWDHVLRLEEFEKTGLQELEAASGMQLAVPAENTSGDKHLKQMYFDAVFNDLKTLCAVCKVYAQDFECLGYAKPTGCTEEQCSTVGISLT